ncbi:helix-turn-helix transcriptional regulator [Massilia sp. TW-1]|uniref:Helix-turn-helix transcriptional regulator n=1 Tax=Telluria antibiotica TaxID=2717319 RepID=A0ABX0P4Q2_9BURK|nr:helix-turn-helix transcriptional regulator [Telluria antibiotica]NIA52207.1 helix-turn-helix transcriptional regulator [Telluria antibiotica]
MHDAHRRQLLGAFIRAHRARLTPARPGGRRRTPGLRREELADAAGLGVTWITWLEQGRDVQASAAALGRLAEALQLSVAERASLFDLADRKDPRAAMDHSDGLAPALLALPALVSAPAYLLDHAWTARAWNEAAAALFAGWLDDDAGDRNLLRYVFLHAAARDLIVGWEARARRLAAEFRADFHRRPADAAMQALVDGLRRDSTLFAQCWDQQDVLHREGGERRFRHPVRGELGFVQTTLLVAAQLEIKLVCLAPQSL